MASLRDRMKGVKYISEQNRSILFSLFRATVRLIPRLIPWQKIVIQRRQYDADVVLGGSDGT